MSPVFNTATITEGRMLLYTTEVSPQRVEVVCFVCKSNAYFGVFQTGLSETLK